MTSTKRLRTFSIEDTSAPFHCPVSPPFSHMHMLDQSPSCANHSAFSLKRNDSVSRFVKIDYHYIFLHFPEFVTFILISLHLYLIQRPSEAWWPFGAQHKEEHSRLWNTEWKFSIIWFSGNNSSINSNSSTRILQIPSNTSKPFIYQLQTVL